MVDLIVWVGIILLFIIGLAGILIPVVPGVGFIFGGVLLYAIADGFNSVSVLTVVLMGAAALLAWLGEYAGAMIGAKAGGAGWATYLGLFLGALAGIAMAGPFGLFPGLILGAFIGAISEGKSTEQAGKTVFYTLVGIVGAKLVQIVLGIGIIAAFIVTIVMQ